jgi:AcrR family transcriptional regulator
MTVLYFRCRRVVGREYDVVSHSIDRQVKSRRRSQNQVNLWPSMATTVITPSKQDVEVKQTRTQTRQQLTRVRLREVAYENMSTKGVDATTIQELTDAANIGFGTFYNYYSSKEALALEVLDCVIHNIGEKNDLITKQLGETDPVRIVTNSVRFVIREMLTNSIWRFWLARLDLLIDRMRIGFGPFGMRDIAAAVDAGRYDLIDNNPNIAWSHLVWLMTAAGRDLVEGHVEGDERTYAEAIMRVNGVSHEDAHAATLSELPATPILPIDFAFEIQPQ